MAHVMLKRTNEKRKRKIESVIVIDDDDENSPCETILKCKIYHAEGIDEPRHRYSKTKRQYYRVYASVNPDINEEPDEARSRFVRGDPNPCWNATFSLSLGEFNPADDDNIGKYLHLEVVKMTEYGSEDPQPSNKEVVVGRTRIHLPHNISQNKSGSFELVKLEPEDGLGIKPAGRIVVSMVLKNEH